MSEKKKPSFGGNTTIGGIIVAIIVAALYFGSGGEIDLSETTNNDETDKPVIDKGEEYFGLTDFLPTSTYGNIIKHKHYTLSYSEKHKQAEWVAYELTRDMVLKGNKDRSDLSFKPDPNLDAAEAVTSDDYRKTGYDRGHLVPAQDMAFDEEALEETFFMTNVSPQERLFNRGIWKSLEGQIRDWGANFDRIYVITGPVLSKRAKARMKTDKSDIPVPHSFYKVILDFHGRDIKAIAFWMKNEESDLPLIAYATTIDEIEAETGIDFFPKLPEKIASKLESEVNIASWAMTREAYSSSLDNKNSQKDLICLDGQCLDSLQAINLWKKVSLINHSE